MASPSPRRNPRVSVGERVGGSLRKGTEGRERSGSWELRRAVRAWGPGVFRTPLFPPSPTVKTLPGAARRLPQAHAAPRRSCSPGGNPLPWQPREAPRTPATPPGWESRATVSWIILKASEAARTWQSPLPVSFTSPSGPAVCRPLYKGCLSSRPHLALTSAASSGLHGRVREATPALPGDPR